MGGGTTESGAETRAQTRLTWVSPGTGALPAQEGALTSSSGPRREKFTPLILFHEEVDTSSMLAPNQQACACTQVSEAGRSPS